MRLFSNQILLTIRLFPNEILLTAKNKAMIKGCKISHHAEDMADIFLFPYFLEQP